MSISLSICRSMVPKEKLSQLRLDEPVDLSSIRVYYMEDDGGSFVTLSVSSEMRSALKQSVQFLGDEYKIPITPVNFSHMKQSMLLWLHALIRHSTTPMDE